MFTAESGFSQKQHFFFPDSSCPYNIHHRDYTVYFHHHCVLKVQAEVLHKSIDYDKEASRWLCNAKEGETCKALFSLAVKVLKNNRYVELTRLDFNTFESNRGQENQNTHTRRTLAYMGAV